MKLYYSRFYQVILKFIEDISIRFTIYQETLNIKSTISL
jgi:hypothetical protein